MRPLSRQVIHLLVVCILSTSSNAADDQGRRLDAWIARVSGHPSIEVRWYVAQEVIDRQTRVMDAFELDETARYRYPDTMLVRTRTLPKNEPADARRAMIYDLDQEIDAAGRWSERQVRGGSERNLGDAHRLRDLVTAQAVRAPVLIGMWLAENPDSWHEAGQGHGVSTYAVPDLKLRFDLRLANDADPASAWVSRIEHVGADGSPMVWWTYDQPIRADNAGFAIGSVRVQYSKARDGSVYEGTPAILESARVIPVTSSGPVGATPASQESAEVRASAGSADASGHSARWPAWLLVALGATAVGVGGLAFWKRFGHTP